MKILKEEKVEEYECPECKSALEFDCNEFKKEGTYSKFKVFLGTEDPCTENGWFECIKCNKRYLIKDCALGLENEI